MGEWEAIMVRTTSLQDKDVWKRGDEGGREIDRERERSRCQKQVAKPSSQRGLWHSIRTEAQLQERRRRCRPKQAFGKRLGRARAASM